MWQVCDSSTLKLRPSELALSLLCTEFQRQCGKEGKGATSAALMGFITELQVKAGAVWIFFQKANSFRNMPIITHSLSVIYHPCAYSSKISSFYFHFFSSFSHCSCCSYFLFNFVIFCLQYFPKCRRPIFPVCATTGSICC
jgi:hypothetical protein